MHSSELNKSVSAVIFNAERTQVLLIKRRDIPVWVLPGGGIEPAEPPETAAQREVLEETGYHVEIKRKVAEYLPVNRLTKYTYFFECDILSGQARLGCETRAVQFFPLTALPKLMPPPYAGWITDAHNNHPELLTKKISGVSYFVLLKLFLQHPVLVARFLLTKVGIHLNI